MRFLMVALFNPRAISNQRCDPNPAIVVEPPKAIVTRQDLLKTTDLIILLSGNIKGHPGAAFLLLEHMMRDARWYVTKNAQTEWSP